MTESLFLADNGSDSVAQPQWQTAVPGFTLTPAEICVSEAHQSSKLSACGLAPEVMGGVVDPAFFIGIGIQSGIRSGISAQGNINMVQKLVVYRPALLGEVLVVHGEIESVVEVPRGHQVQTRVIFEDKNGNKVIDASRTSLRPDPDKKNVQGAGVRPDPVVAQPEHAQVLSAHELTPEQVKDYSLEGNSIHYEEEAAKAAGFRAPMIGGGMGVHFMLAALWSRCTPATLDLSLYFRRPIFWDEKFTAAVVTESSEQTQAVDQWRALCLLRDEGPKGLKVLTEARINHLAEAGRT